MITTLVTCLYDIKRDNLGEGWSRSFDHYLSKLSELLETPDNLIIFGEKELKEYIFQHRSEHNTQFIERSIEWFKNDFFDKIQSIRNNPEWYNQSGWLPESTQAKLEMYNPLVMSKMFLLNDAQIMDKFNSDHLYWIDAGITNTVNKGYFTHDKVIEKINKFNNKFLFLAFPYQAETEIHGFTYPHINSYCGCDVKLVGRGGFFGGPKSAISEINSIYYNLLNTTLSGGYMGTEESIFSILMYKYPELINYFEIEENGLIYSFFEAIKNDEVKLKSTSYTFPPLDFNNIGLYVITYNSPKQFQTLIESFKQYDINFLKSPKKYLLNNSLNRDTDQDYKNLCSKFNFEEIKKDNIGICGGRQFIAEHAEEMGFDAYFFFEDDMFFYNGNDYFCRNGFIRKINDLYNKGLNILEKEQLDFLKLNFTEFFGDNQKQWAWHNVPQEVRSKFFPDKPIKSNNDVNEAPYLNFNNIKSYKGLPYALGEIFYCNWPQIISKNGNQKMFLNVKWDYPYEQTWMSYIFQETKSKNIKPGILLATPTEHDRFDFYPGEERREN